MKFFGKHDEEEKFKKKKPSIIYIAFRMMLSLTMMVILGMGVYLAVRQFSGIDPIKSDPKAIILSLISSQKAGDLASKILGAEPPKNLTDLKNVINKTTESVSPVENDEKPPEGKVVLKFGVVADSHTDNQNLKKGLDKARQDGAKFIVGLGDYTQVGTIEELEAAKNIFESSNLPYYLVAGDHDLWASRENSQGSVEHFTQVFGSPYQAFTDANIRFILVFNSDNYLGVDSVQRGWIGDELKKVSENKYLTSLVFLHEPLYHPSSDHFMGKEKKELVAQAESLASEMSQKGVTEVFAGDTHFFARYTDPKTSLKMTTVGAVTSERNAQKSRFAIVDVYENGGYTVSDLEI